ncbi:hypothetical protein Barb7_00092 [Bacteroidales bacterium Barb7]|nr:hypothetical protein Barb7_00092 [Bacteroidales bacterium Barb7]
MYIEFIKPAPGYAYFKGDKADIAYDRANELITSGFVKKLDELKPVESDLPVSIPFRSVLIKEGLRTIEQVIAAKETISEIKGISKKSTDEILNFLKTLETSKAE